MKLTRKQQDERLNPHRSAGKWFYLGEGYGGNACSFHQHSINGISNVFGIQVSTLLRALDKCGYLDQWDRKQQILKKVTR